MCADYMQRLRDLCDDLIYALIPKAWVCWYLRRHVPVNMWCQEHGLRRICIRCGKVL